jgi:hypothetical protein
VNKMPCRRTKMTWTTPTWNVGFAHQGLHFIGNPAMSFAALPRRHTWHDQISHGLRELGSRTTTALHAPRKRSRPVRTLLYERRAHNRTLGTDTVF